MSWWAIVGSVVVGAVGVMAVRFDLNRWLEQRRESRKDRLRMLCPHVQPTKVNGADGLESLIVSPPGTGGWWCSRCGREFIDGKKEGEENLMWWAGNLRELVETNRRWLRLHRKVWP